MKPKRHLADASAFWADLGVSVEEQAEMAAWAFSGAPVPEPERVELWENHHRGWNTISAPGERHRRRRPMLADLAAMLAEYAEA